jgi:hypothetical protein
MIETLAERGHTWNAVGMAYRFGRYVEEFENQEFDDNVRRDLKAQEARAEGGRKRAKSAKPRHDKIIADYMREAQKLKSEGVRFTKTVVMAQIGKKHGLQRSQAIWVLSAGEKTIRDQSKPDK